MALPFFHLSQMFKPAMADDDLKEIKGSSEFVQVDNTKTPIRMSKQAAVLRRKTQHVGQQTSKVSRRMTDESSNDISVNIFSLR